VRLPLSFDLAFQRLGSGLGRMLSSILAITLGVALVVAVQMMNSTVLRSFLDTIDETTGRAALSVVTDGGFTISEDLVPTVGSVPGVKLAVPLVTGVAFPDDGSGELLNIFGVDLGNDDAIRVYDPAGQAGALVEDPLVFLNQPDSILVGKPLAARRGLRIGDGLDLVVPAGVRRFTIRGLLEETGVARTIGGRIVVMDVYAAQRVLTAEGQINQIDLVLQDDADLASVRAAVAARLPDGVRVEEPTLRKEVLRRTIAGFQAMITAFGILSALAGLVICYSRLTAAFEARAWEVGLLRAVGLRRSAVFVELLKESLLLGAAGTVLGVPLGLLIGRAGLPKMAEATALTYGLAATTPAPRFSLGHVLLGVAVGATAALLAAALPALRVSATSPVAVLTMRGRDAPPATSRVPRRALPALLLLLVGLLLARRVWQAAALGNITTAIIALVVCLLARPVVRAGGVLLAPVWEGVFGQAGWFAAQHLREESRRAALTVATLGIGLGVVLMFGMLGWSLERTVVSQLNSRFRVDLVLTSPASNAGWRWSPVSDRVRDDVQSVAGVAAVVGQQIRDVGYQGAAATLFSYDAPCFSDPDVCRWPLLPGALPQALELVALGDAVLVSGSVATQHGLQPGDDLELSSPNGRQRLRVAGIAREEPANAIIIGRDRYRAGWNDPTVASLFVRIARGADAARVEAEILRRVGQQHRLQAIPVADFVDFLGGQVRQAFSVLYVMEAVVFLLVSIGIADTLSGQVLERRRELGLMRAVGTRRRHLFGIVLAEGLALGVLGLGLALAAGLGLGLFWAQVQFPALLGWNPDLHVPYGFAAVAAGLTLGLCALAALLPSAAAARLRVTEVLRYE
jgi:putative ABC transport system permease protein